MQASAPEGGPGPEEESLPSPRRIKRRAIDLLREGHRLHGSKKKKVAPEAAERIATRLSEVERLLPTRKNKVELDAGGLFHAAVALDQGLSQTYGAWRKGAIRELLEALVMAVFLAVVIRLFFVEAFSIPSSSMYPTLAIGDHLFISKIRYGLYAPFSTSRLVEWDQPSHGDVIVFEYRAPGEPLDGEDFIKRVVAIPGDRIRMENDRLVLNGKTIQTEIVSESTCPIFEGVDYSDKATRQCPCVVQRETVGDVSWTTQHITETGCSPGTVEPSDRWPLEYAPVPRYFGARSNNPAWPDVVVPEGHVLVMGDNRDNSQDGRFWGFVPYDRIKGKAFVIWLARDLGRIFNGMY